MKRLWISLLILVVVFPFTSFAKQGIGWHWLNQKADERRQERLQAKQEDSSGDYYRLGREVLSNTTSPRRRRIVQTATVTGVVDGSSIIVQQSDNSYEEIRLLGAEAPQIIRDGVECYGQHAREALRDMLVGKQVTIEREEAYQRDSYKRLVRYVRLGSQDMNAWMIWHGYAFADTTHDHERLNEYTALEQRAKEDKKGIWSSACDYNADKDDVRVLE